MINKTYRSKLIFKDNRWMIIDISFLMSWKRMIADKNVEINSEIEQFEESLKRYVPLHPLPELYDGVDPIPYIREQSLYSLIDNKEYFVSYKIINDSTTKMDGHNTIEYAVIMEKK